MFANPEELLRYLKNEGVKFVDVRFCDLPGVMQHFTVPVESFDENVFTDGLAFDGSSIRGFQQIHESDMLLLPDVATCLRRPVPGGEDARAELLHPRPVHPRGLLAATRATWPRRPRPTWPPAASPTPRTSAPRRSSTSSTRSATRPARTRRTTTSTRSRAGGTAAARRRAATAATRPPTRAATSRCRRSTTTPTCVTRWCAT